MTKTTMTLIALIAMLHVYIAWFEIFAWTSVGPGMFETLPPDLFVQTVQMAANQGVYNAFLVAGLIWSLLIRDHDWQRRVATCFLIFVAVAGLAAAATMAVSAGMIQFIPASLALSMLHLGRRSAA